ncbi:hypothetical protein M0R72_19750 [Candidatus Pacearchaeota archaeon]|jgi:hypothetical protein|nr:hypothetical protein [Candidatus Pacearchaeota archaeon]
MQERIAVYISPNERGSDRAKHLALAISEDNRFMLPSFQEIDVDLRFSTESICKEPYCVDGLDANYQNCMKCGGSGKVHNIFNAELKEPADYVSSALGKDGHLYQQVLAMREAGHPAMILVLGDDADVNMAVKDSLVTRYRGKELGYQIASYNDRLQDFEAQAYSLGIPVMRWKASPWKRLLSTSHKILVGGNLMGYRPRPADNERDLAAASLLFKGIGPKILEPILAEYDLCFVPKGEFARQPCDMPGIGPKRAAIIDKKIAMVYGMRAKA